MSTYAMVRLLHVLTAVLGLGLIAAGGIVARAPRTTAPTELLVLSRLSSGALVVMLLTGAGADLLSGGVYHDKWWFRLSGLSLFVAGGFVGFGRRQLRRWGSGELDVALARRRVAGSAWAACAVVAWITVLMELRPFQ